MRKNNQHSHVSLNDLRHPNKSDDQIWVEETGRAPLLELDKSLFVKTQEEKELLKRLKKEAKATA